jgi:hypothetical protein
MTFREKDEDYAAFERVLEEYLAWMRDCQHASEGTLKGGTNYQLPPCLLPATTLSCISWLSS